jgi:excisionase family DNA binding protein
MLMDKQRSFLATWLSVQQVAERTGLCTTTVYALIRRGALPASHFGRHLRVDPKKLDAWAEAGGSSHGAQPGAKAVQIEAVKPSGETK